jgi:CubicO group peptidase (beta-lactamase class C family)
MNTIAFPSVMKRREALRRALRGSAGVVALLSAPQLAYAAGKGGPGGFSPERLKLVTAAMQSAVDKGEVDGIVTLLYRHGEVAQVNTVGWQSKTANLPMKRDTIFRMASMTKPITGVATMILVDEGKLKLDDPVDRWLPELANPKLLKDPMAPLDSAAPSPRPIRVVDLMTHRSGIATADMNKGPIAKALGEANAARTQGYDAWMKAIGALPLATEPGSFFNYGNSTDVLGILVERVSGVKFPEFLQTRIFAPLGMTDTGFFVPKEKHGRVAVAPPATSGAPPAAVAVSMPAFPAPAGGLFSTADDYLKFARMMLGRGKLGDVRIISHRAIDYMTANYLTPEQRKMPFVGIQNFWLGEGFGLTVAVKDNLAVNSAITGVGGPGTYGWPGATGVWWVVDPKEDMIQLYLVQGGSNEASRRAFQATAYNAIDD